MTLLPRFRLILIAVLLTMTSSLAFAAASDAEEFVRERHEQLVALLQQPKSSVREGKVSSSIDEVFDYQQLARRSLGDEWSKRTDAERKQFQELLEQLVRKTYRKSVNTTLGYSVEYRGTRKSGDDTVVSTIAKHKTDKRKAPISIDYVLAPSGNKWRAVDVVIEGSSLVDNYRSQFTRIIKKKGFTDLVDKMKRRIEKGQ